MDITEIDRQILADGVVRFHFALPSAAFLYFGYILESLEGLCLYTTPPASSGIMQVDVVPDYIKEFDSILAQLKIFDPPA
jgi:hypothetical protein